MSELWTNYQPHTFTSDQQKIIVSSFNFVKNTIASGSNPKFPAATNFSKISWDNKLEEVAAVSVSKVALKPYTYYCTLTENTEATYTLYYEDPTNDTNVESLISDMSLFFMLQTLSRDVQWVASYYAHTSKVGCSWGEYDIAEYADDSDSDELKMRHIRSIQCIADTVSDDYESYAFGVPCSACLSNEKCDDVYTSLCSPVQL